MEGGDEGEILTAEPVRPNLASPSGGSGGCDRNGGWQPGLTGLSVALRRQAGAETEERNAAGGLDHESIHGPQQLLSNSATEDGDDKQPRGTDIGQVALTRGTAERG